MANTFQKKLRSKKKLLKIFPKMKNLKSILSLALLLSTFAAQAQIGNYFDRFKDARKWSVGVQLSGTALHGDADVLRMGVAGGLYLKYSIAQSFGLSLNANLGVLNGSRDENDPFIGTNQTTNISARSGDSYMVTNNFKDVSLTTVYTLGNISFLRPLRRVQLFIFTGVGVTFSDAEGSFDNAADAQEYYNGDEARYDRVDRDGSGNITNVYMEYKGNDLIIPAGLGFKWNLSRAFDLGVEYRLNFSRADLLDAFAFGEWSNRTKDSYSLLGVQLSYKFGGKDKENHNDWLNPVESIYKTLDTLIEIGDKVEQLLLDDDEDGVANYYDKDPDSEPGALVTTKGEMLDMDGDSIPDHRDQQLYSEKGSTVDESGVMVDTDDDGVPDYRDEDTNTPAGAMVDRQGREINISCCNCDEVVLPAIVFDPGSSKIRPEFYGALYSVAEKMRSCPDLKVDAIGYAVGSKAASQLAEQRINAIIDYLNGQYGIPRDRFITNSSAKAESGVEYSSRRIDLKKSN